MKISAKDLSGVIMAVSMLAFSSCAEQETPSAETSIETSVSENTLMECEGYTIDTCGSWELSDRLSDREENVNEQTFVLSDIRDAEDSSTVVVIQTVDPAGYDDSEQFGKHLSKLYNEKAVKVISQDKCFIGDYEAYEIIFNISVNDSEIHLKARHTVLVCDGRLYSFMLAAYPQKYDDAADKTDLMLSTFRITE